MKYTRQRRHSSGGRWTDVSYSCVLFWMKEEGNHFQTQYVYVYVLDQVDLNNILHSLYYSTLSNILRCILQFDVQRTYSFSLLPPSIISHSLNIRRILTEALALLATSEAHR